MPTVKLEIGQRCRTLSGSGVPGFIQTGLIYWDFACKGSGGGGTNGRERKKIYQCSIRHTQPRGFFLNLVFALHVYFSCSSYGIGKRERGLGGGETGGVDGTRPDSFYIISLCPQSGSGWATSMMFLVHIFLDWTREIKIGEAMLGLVSNMARLGLPDPGWRSLKRQQCGWLVYGGLIVQGGKRKLLLGSSKWAALE